MTITVSDIREFLKDLPSEFVSDATIEKQLEQAYWEISKEKSAYTTQEDEDKTVVLHAGYYTTLAYMAEAERSLGVIPPSLLQLANELEARLEKAMQYIKRGSPGKTEVFAVADTLWKYRRESVETSDT